VRCPNLYDFKNADARPDYLRSDFDHDWHFY
jgi:hypothetical protein